MRIGVTSMRTLFNGDMLTEQPRKPTGSLSNIGPPFLSMTHDVIPATAAYIDGKGGFKHSMGKRPHLILVHAGGVAG